MMRLVAVLVLTSMLTTVSGYQYNYTISCSNTPLNWVDDKYGVDCATMKAKSYCAKHGGLIGTDGLTANEACCGCGGGKRDQRLVTMVPNQFKAWQELFTATAGKTSWTCCADKFGDPCGCDDHVICCLLYTSPSPRD